MNFYLAITSLVGIVTLVFIYLVYFKEKERSGFTQEFEVPLKIFFSRPKVSTVKKSETIKPARKTPITGVCSFCKKKESLPFKCKFCSEIFCSEHRLPENHKCTELINNI